ncbi:RNA polymerase sigma factor RpoD/SigA [bacterium]|nr:RNA polymerase sigma factor RpoD/SigA [bacterium]
MISMKKSLVTNPAKVIYVDTVSQSNELSDYFRRANAIKNLDVEREKELAKRAKTGDLFAKNELIQANLKLVITIARKAIHVSRLPMIDLIQEGNLGLMVAVDKFNPDLGYRFSTYATWWIKQAMFKAISEQSYCMKIPVYIQETLSKFSKLKTEMEQAQNQQVTNSEVAKKLNIEPEKINTYLSAFSNTISIEGSFDANNGSELSVAEVVADERESVEKKVEFEELKREISTVISTLKEREQTVIKMRFGLENFTKTTLEDIGKIFGVTKECIRQTENRALAKLRNGLAY